MSSYIRGSVKHSRHYPFRYVPQQLDGTQNGEIRDREKVIRGLKKADTPILTGYQIFHNFMRPHEGLEGKTPAEKAGIKVEG